MKVVLNALLNSEYERRMLSYTKRGTPIIWDLPFYGDKDEVKGAIRVLEHPDVVAALKKGLLLSEAQVFIWVSRDGEIDYGLVQGYYFITLWVPWAAKAITSEVKEVAEKVYKLACEKYNRERQYKEDVIRNLVNPFNNLSRQERKNLLQNLLKNIHPSWGDLRKEAEYLLVFC